MHATKISLTDFIDFVNRPSMSEKLTKVREIKHRGPYSSAGDFYRPVREAVIRTHATGRDKWAIRNTIERLAGAGADFRERLERYEMLADAYIGWWGRRRLDWFEPGWQVGSLQGLPISVNPELGLDIDGTPHIVKLYFKEPPLSKRYAEVVACLMHETLAGQAPTGGLIALLDVRRRRLHRLSPRPDLSILVAGEMAALTTMWARA